MCLHIRWNSPRATGIPPGDGLQAWTATAALPWVSSLPVHPVNSEPLSLHNCISQFLKITLSIYILNIHIYPIDQLMSEFWKKGKNTVGVFSRLQEGRGRSVFSVLKRCLGCLQRLLVRSRETWWTRTPTTTAIPTTITCVLPSTVHPPEPKPPTESWEGIILSH